MATLLIILKLLFLLPFSRIFKNFHIQRRVETVCLHIINCHLNLCLSLYVLWWQLSQSGFKRLTKWLLWRLSSVRHLFPLLLYVLGCRVCFVLLILKRDTLHIPSNLCTQLKGNLLVEGKYVKINFVSYTRSILCGGILKSHKFTLLTVSTREIFLSCQRGRKFKLKYLTEDKTENRLERDT